MSLCDRNSAPGIETYKKHDRHTSKFSIHHPVIKLRNTETAKFGKLCTLPWQDVTLHGSGPSIFTAAPPTGHQQHFTLPRKTYQLRAVLNHREPGSFAVKVS